MNLWKVNDLREHLALSPSGARKLIDQFSDLLSDHANPPKGGTRELTAQDVAILSRVADILNDVSTYEAARPIIEEEIERGEFAQADDYPEDLDPDGMIPVVKYQTDMAAIEQKVIELQNQRDARFAELQAEHDQMKEERDKAQAEAAELRGEIKQLQKQIDQLREDADRNRELDRQIAVLEYKLQQLEAGDE